MRSVFLEDKYLAARLGRYPRFLAICKTLSFVIGLTPGLSCKARCTEPIEVPRAFAMSRSVVGGLPIFLWPVFIPNRPNGWGSYLDSSEPQTLTELARIRKSNE